MYPPGVECIGERAADVLLTDEFTEGARTPFTGEDQITHAAVPTPGTDAREAARARIPPAPGVAATVAPFRAWRGLRLAVARDPTRATMEG